MAVREVAALRVEEREIGNRERERDTHTERERERSARGRSTAARAAGVQIRASSRMSRTIT